MAAQFAGLAVLATAMWLARPPSPAAYRALGGSPATAGGNAVLMLKPTTTEGELRRLLVGSGARLVDGPTASGAYVLHVPQGGRPAALARLKSDANVVVAEPIDGNSPR
jgi:hypothetical protein